MSYCISYLTAYLYSNWWIIGHDYVDVRWLKTKAKRSMTKDSNYHLTS